MPRHYIPTDRPVGRPKGAKAKVRPLHEGLPSLPKPVEFINGQPVKPKRGRKPGSKNRKTIEREEREQLERQRDKAIEDCKKYLSNELQREKLQQELLAPPPVVNDLPDTVDNSSPTILLRLNDTDELSYLQMRDVMLQRIKTQAATYADGTPIETTRTGRKKMKANKLGVHSQRAKLFDEYGDPIKRSPRKQNTAFRERQRKRFDAIKAGKVPGKKLGRPLGSKNKPKLFQQEELVYEQGKNFYD